MSTKFGLLIDFDLANTVASTTKKPELELSIGVRHLHISALGGSIWMKFGNFMQNIIRRRHRVVVEDRSVAPV